MGDYGRYEPNDKQIEATQYLLAHGLTNKFIDLNYKLVAQNQVSLVRFFSESVSNIIFCLYRQKLVRVRVPMSTALSRNGHTSIPVAWMTIQRVAVNWGYHIHGMQTCK